MKLSLIVPLALTACTQPLVDAGEVVAARAKLQICHKGHTIEVAESAWPAHQAHGDTAGTCGAPPAFAGFASGVEIPAERPRDVAVGDVDLDGRPDVVTVDAVADALTILLDRTSPGTPSFEAAIVATDSTPVRLAIADVNGDGKADLVVANNNSLSIFLNATVAGSPMALAPRQDFAIAENPMAIAIGDFNGDGRPDLAIGTSFSTVAIYLNTTAPGAATAQLAPEVVFGAGVTPVGLAVADLDGDGRPDLAITEDNQAVVSILLDATPTGATTAVFSAATNFATGAQPVWVAAADFNGDGRPDLAVANRGSNNLSVLLDTAGGALAPAVSVPATSLPINVIAGDFDRDGRPDLAIANLGASSVSILLDATAHGATTPVFTVAGDFATGVSPVAIATADFDGDGTLDLAVANEDSSTVSILLGR